MACELYSIVACCRSVKLCALALGLSDRNKTKIQNDMLFSPKPNLVYLIPPSIPWVQSQQIDYC